MKTLAVLPAAFLALAAIGCGGRDGLAPVSGTLTVEGKAVPSGNLTFYPDAAKGNASQHQPTGTIEAGGKFAVYVPGPKKGAPPGWYKVVVYAVDDPQPGKPNRYFVNRKYAEVATTPLSVEVVEKPEPGRYDWKLDP